MIHLLLAAAGVRLPQLEKRHLNALQTVMHSDYNALQCIVTCIVTVVCSVVQTLQLQLSSIPAVQRCTH
jgi:hypothetical protein